MIFSNILGRSLFFVAFFIVWSTLADQSLEDSLKSINLSNVWKANHNESEKILSDCKNEISKSGAFGENPVGCVMDCMYRKMNFVVENKFIFENFNNTTIPLFEGYPGYTDISDIMKACAEKVNAMDDLKFCQVSLKINDCSHEEYLKLNEPATARVQQFFSHSEL